MLKESSQLASSLTVAGKSSLSAVDVSGAVSLSSTLQVAGKK